MISAIRTPLPPGGPALNGPSRPFCLALFRVVRFAESLQIVFVKRRAAVCNLGDVVSLQVDTRTAHSACWFPLKLLFSDPCTLSASQRQSVGAWRLPRFAFVLIAPAFVGRYSPAPTGATARRSVRNRTHQPLIEAGTRHNKGPEGIPSRPLYAVLVTKNHFTKEFTLSCQGTLGRGVSRRGGVLPCLLPAAPPWCA